MNTPLDHSLLSARSALRLAAGFGLASLGALPASALSASPVLAEVSVNIQIDPAPPPPRKEVIVEKDRPGPDYIWIAGFWDGTPGHYVWTPGHWDRPPHPGAHWVAPHWDKDRDGHYHQTKGQWADDKKR